MAYEDPGKIITVDAGQDLSAHQFRFVTLAADGQVDPAGDGDDAIGVLQNKPDAAGKSASVMQTGISKVTAGAQIDAGSRVTSDGTGRAVATIAEDEYVLGVAMSTSGGAGEVMSVLLMCPGTIDINQA